jgi:hypothetical protein
MVKHALTIALVKSFFKSWTTWVQQGHVVVDDVQDVLGIEEDGTNSSNSESP